MQGVDDVLQLHPDPVTIGEVLEPDPRPFHRPLRGPTVQVVADDPLLFPQPTQHAGMQVTAQEIEPLPAWPQTGLSCLETRP